MSFSDEINDEKKETILPDFDDGAQIFDKDALRIQIASIADEDQRTSCEMRFAFTGKRIDDMHAAYALEEAAYIDEHLKPEPLLELTPDGCETHYDQEVDRLKGLFAQTDKAIAMQNRIDQRSEELWGRVQVWADVYAPQDNRDVPDTKQEHDPSQERLSDVFHNMPRH